MTEELWHIYFLVDPRDAAIFYVGISRNPGERYFQHQRDKESSAYQRCKRLRDNFGMMPLLLMGEQNLDEQTARAKEAEYLLTLHNLDNSNGHPERCLACTRGFVTVAVGVLECLRKVA